jgi:signal transduction histidine kinase
MTTGSRRPRLFVPERPENRREETSSEPVLNAEDIPVAGLDNPLACDLEVVLSAWHTATERLRKTHETLCDEVRRLTHELEAKNLELVRQNRLADLGQMAAHVAHEVRNGLAPVTLYLSLLRRRLANDAEGLRVLDNLESGFTSLEATVHDMLSFTSDRQPAWRRFVLPDLIVEVIDSLAPQLNAASLRIELDVPPQLAVSCDREMLRRALLNLVLNAVDAMPAGGEICVTVTRDPGGFELEVADNGPGIPTELVPRIFEPFVTTKSEGAGLGLAIVHRVAEAHGGVVRAVNCPEGGAAFTLRIPQRRMQEAA